MKPANLESHLGYWLRLVSIQVAATFAPALQERGLSVAEWIALSRIGATAGLSCAELAAAMGMTRGAISKVLDKLQHKEWIARAVSEADSRVQVLSLTRRGRRRLPELSRIADGNDAHFFGGLDTAERRLCELCCARWPMAIRSASGAMGAGATLPPGTALELLAAGTPIPIRRLLRALTRPRGIGVGVVFLLRLRLRRPLLRR
jgi:DNA-binding MarR family transcriptional regulator